LAQENTPKRIFRALDNLSPSEIKLSQLPRKANALYNLKFNEYGQLVKRRGYVKHNSQSLGDYPIIALHRSYRQGAEVRELLAVCNRNLYRINDATGQAELIAQLEADDAVFVDFYNTCYILSGKLYKWNGTDFYTVGVTPPASAPTGSVQSGGNLSTGKYLVAYTFVDKDGYESNPSPQAEFNVTSSGSKITLTIATSSDPKVVKRRIYRSTADGGILYLDTEVDDNTTTSVELTKSDLELAAGQILETNHDLPPDGAKLLARRRSRLYIAKDDALSISSLAEPEYFPLELTFYTTARQRITGLAEHGPAMCILTADTVEQLTGYSEDSFALQSAYAPEGCIAPKSVVVAQGALIYLGVDGIYYFDGEVSRPLNTQLSEYLKANINPSYAHLSAATYFDNKYLLSYPKGESNVPNETVYVDLKLGTTGIYSYAFSCFARLDKGADGLRLFAGDPKRGYIYRLEEATTDDGEQITAYDALEPFDFGVPDAYKQIYEVYVKVWAAGPSTLRLYYSLDYGEEKHIDAAVQHGWNWYRLRLPGGGQRCRAFGMRPTLTSSYDFIIAGYMIVFRVEVPEWS